MKPEHRKYILENIRKKSVKQIAKELGIKERKVRKFLERKGKPGARGAGNEGPEVRRPLKKKTIFISIAIIIILGFGIYANSVDSEFIWDDANLVENNVYLRSWANTSKFFTENLGGGVGRESSSYRPFQLLSYMVNYSLWKLDTRPYHLTNILFHVLAAAALFWLIDILFGDRLMSLICGILFVAHPIHTEAVSYIAGRADSMVAVFMILSFILYIKKRKLYLLLLSYLCALLSKENALILPVLLLLYHYVFKKKIKTVKFSSVLGVSFVYIFLRATVLKFMPSHIIYHDTLFQRIPGFFAAMTKYVQLLFLPFDLHMEYAYIHFNFSDPAVIFGMIISFLLIAYAVRKREKSPLIFFSIFWFFIALLPQSNLYAVNAYMAEHWLYLPSVGFFMILAKGLSDLYKKGKLRIFAIVFVAGLAAFYSYLTIKQNNYWKEPISFYERTLEYAPRSLRLYNDLGAAYYTKGEYKKAIGLFKKAIKAVPTYANAYSNLGGVYNNLGKHKEAIPLFKKAIELKPDFADAHYNLGNAYDHLGRRKDAVASFKKTLEINPGYVKALNNLGTVYSVLGRKEEALGLFKKAIKINPRYAEAHANLAASYYDEKQYGLAIKHCDRAAELGYKTSPAFLKALQPYRK